jgi:DNA-binding MarR family transcriptional regulator
MIRKSNYSRAELLEAIGRAVQAFQDATDEVDEAAAARLHVNRTDLRCLGVLSQSGATSASTLADRAGLTRGAMTTALDRLETAGWVKRVWDQEDRRTVRIEITPAARKEIENLYGELAKEGMRLLQGYSSRDLAAVLRYLEDGRELQRRHALHVRRRGERS